MRPRFFSQKMAANDPEKKMPSTHAYAITRSAKVAVLKKERYRTKSWELGPTNISKNSRLTPVES